MASYQYIYVMKDLCKTFPGGKEVLKHIWLSFFPGAKIGVIGPNGAGKSTLMKIMAGLDDNFTGEAWPAEGVKVGYLPQEPQLDPTKNVIENIMDGVGEVRDLMKRWEEVNNAFADPDADMDKLLAEQAELQEKIDAVGGWDFERNVEIAMDALRCPPADADVKLAAHHCDDIVIQCKAAFLQRPADDDLPVGNDGNLRRIRTDVYDHVPFRPQHGKPDGYGIRDSLVDEMNPSGAER
jgi:energy-coupling factor transporter ATP-binding protein EcfA2